jgi:radical SAM superfamily enzyme YgiQ (UPF0313 family)
MVYRPVRELPHEEVIRCADELVKNCGYSEISLVSLSSGDYHDINGLIEKLKPSLQQRHISLSLPSLRLDRSSIDLIEALPQKRRTTLTFAPEAGSDRLRCAINKEIPEQVILETFAAAFAKGWLNLKLYFMIGLPSETEEDVHAIVSLVRRIVQLGAQGYKKNPQLRVNVSTFVPKPHTPCQWNAQDSSQSILAKQEILKRGLHRSGVNLSWGDTNVSLLEAVLSRGDRRLGSAIHAAWKLGSRLEAWHEGFNFANWQAALHGCGLDPLFYAGRYRGFEELLPWSHIDMGVSVDFLRRENRNITDARTTGDCRTLRCNSCGMQETLASCRQRLS